MTIIEAHLSFKLSLDKIDSLNYPNLEPEEIDLILNQGYRTYIKQTYGFNNIKKQSFEETQKRTEDLKNVIKTANLVPIAYNSFNIDSNAQFVILPTDHWFIIQERVEVSYLDCNNTLISSIIEVRPTQHMEFDKVIKDAFKKPDENKVLRLMENGQVELVSSTGITITSYKLRYLKQPVILSLSLGVGFETSDHTHQEIIDTCVVIALEGIEAKRNSTFNPLINNKKE